MTHTAKIRKKILVALDGSQRSARTVDYLCGFKHFHTLDIHLFHVLSDVPESYLDMNLRPSGRTAAMAVQSWQARYRRDITEFLERSRSQLLAAGLPQGAVTLEVKNRDQGIARDILAEAAQGYFALVARRRGFGDMPELPIGSVANKLIEKAVAIPLILAGNNTPKGAILLAVDGSPGSDRAVRFAADVIKDSPCSVTLCSIVRGYSTAGQSSEQESPLDSALVEEVESFMVLDDARKVLEEAGVDTGAISHELITGTASRAGTIARLAQEHCCDTLVLGRKGWSNVKDFSIGRVAWKTLHAAKKSTVWIVS